MRPLPAAAASRSAARSAARGAASVLPPLRGLLVLALLLSVPATLRAQVDGGPTTREMNLVNWMEFARLVPASIETVLLPVGTLEPHGVIPNGADNLAPEAMGRAIAERLNAMIAPTLNYGVTGSMRGYPGAFAIGEEAYRAFLADILRGLARNGFRNVIVLNGHGGPQTAILREVAARVSDEERVRVLVVNWWTLASDDTHAVFGEDGGHAGNNETAYVQAIVPEHVHPEWYGGPEMTTAYPAPNSWDAHPFPSSIGLYREGEGFPTFDEAQAREYFRRVNERVASLVEEVVRKWDAAGLYR